MLNPLPHTDVVLLPGDYFVGAGQFKVRTLLGSCVSITLWDPVRRVGAMCHIMLSGRRGGGRRDARYAEDALALMLAELAAYGVAAKDLQAKVFGGGNMFPSLVGRDGQLMASRDGDVGRRNGEVACALLAAHGIPVVSHSLYGNGHRRIQFDLTNGDVWSRQDQPTAIPAGIVIPMPTQRKLSTAAPAPAANSQAQACIA